MEYKRVADRLGWKTEWIKEGGEEMVYCILYIYCILCIVYGILYIMYIV